MSTRCAIIIKVKDEDLGKIKKFDKDKLPKGVKLSEWNCYGDEIGDETSKGVKLTKPYIGIYCHSDGYLDGVGKVLKEVFNDYEAALNLVVGGFCSVVWYDEVRHYANRKCEEWGYIKPIKGDTPIEVESHIGHNGYVYLLEDGEWGVLSGGEFIDYDNNTEID